MKDKQLTPLLHAMQPNDISQAAITTLDTLLDRCTINLVTQLTGVSRATLYRWLDEDVPLDAVNHVVAGWFILVCETSPKIQLLMERAPLTHPRLAKRWLEGEENEHSTEA